MQHELVIIATGASPLLEVDAAIPLGISFAFSPLKTYLLAIIGNGIPLIPLLWFWRTGSVWLSARWPFFARMLELIYKYTRAKHGARMENAGLGALIVLLALPIPFAGAWTATVLAFLCGFPFWKSFWAILCGVLLGGLVVLGITLGVVHFI